VLAKLADFPANLQSPKPIFPSPEAIPFKALF